MGFQKGIIPLLGTIGNITFYESKHGFVARKKSRSIANKIKKDPTFVRTRETMSEFGRACKANKLLRVAFKTQLKNVSDGDLVPRLSKMMMSVIKEDATNLRGKRTVIDGNLEVLKGFDFNAKSTLDNRLSVPKQTSIDRVNGKLSVNVESFIPNKALSAPFECTHFKLISAAAEIDFEKSTWTVDLHESGVNPWDGNPSADINFVNNVPANSTLPLFLVLGVEFYQEGKNGVMSLLNSGAFTTLQLIDVSKG